MRWSSWSSWFKFAWASRSASRVKRFLVQFFGEFGSEAPNKPNQDFSGGCDSTRPCSFTTIIADVFDNESFLSSCGAP